MDRTPAEEARDAADRRARELQHEALKYLNGIPLRDQVARVMGWLAKGGIWRDVAADWAEGRAQELDDATPDADVERALDRIIGFDARLEGQDSYLFTPVDMAAWLTEFERISEGGSDSGSGREDR